MCIHLGVYGEIVSVCELSISPFTSILTRHLIESINNDGHSWNVFHEVRRLLYQCVVFYIFSFDIYRYIAEPGIANIPISTFG